ncbi:MAG: hypothetical protein LBT38_01535 [Deltaproteobacteria bacterium]|jgi:type II secretory pathway predicted ATPase ExeA|nr:hypothetical protein [Deltaproteobacteria bacterium]
MDYEAFFKLKERPFKNPLEDKFFLPLPAFDELCQTLTNEPRPNFLILRGQEGSGKSSFLRRLPWVIKDKIVVAPILKTGRHFKDILRDSLVSFGLGFKCSPQIPEESLLGFFQNAVSNFVASNYGLVLVADGALSLSEENLNDLLHLLSLEPQWAGQTTLLAAARTLSSWPSPKFASAKTLEIPPLTLEQSSQYVNKRLKMAGARKEIFTPGALTTLHTVSQGLPAAINAIAERSLLTAWASNKKEITPSFINQAKASLDKPQAINPQAAKRAAGYQPGRQKIHSRPVRITLAATMVLAFSFVMVLWPKSPETKEPAPDRPEITEPSVAPLPQEVPTATPAAAPALPGQTPGLGLPTLPPVLLSLPHNTMALVVNQSLSQARLWQGRLRNSGLKAELLAPELKEPGLYLIGRPNSRFSLIFQFPPGQEVPKDVSEKLWRQVETLLPQDILPLIVADSERLIRPVHAGSLESLQKKITVWVNSQEYKFTNDLASLYSDPFTYYEPGQKPQTIARENFQVALESEARTSGDVKLAISEPLISLDPRDHNRAWVIFNLRYDSKLRQDIGLRTLILEKSRLGGDWLIKAELWIRENSLQS